MPSRRLVATLLALLVVPVAGCVGADDADPSSAADDPDPTDDAVSTADETADEPERVSWTLSGCRVALILVPTDAASLEEHLPDGFAAGDAQDAFGIPPDPRGEAALGVEAFQCQAGSTVNGTADSLAYGALFAAVEPPADQDTSDADLVLYKWETLVPDEDRRQLLQEAGMPAVDGATHLSGLQSTPAGHSFHVSLTLDGNTHTLDGSTSAPADEFRDGLPFVEFQAGDDGVGRWVSTANEAPDAFQGTGILDPAPGSRVADIVGDEPSQGYVVAATTVTFSEGFVEIPAGS